MPVDPVRLEALITLKRNRLMREAEKGRSDHESLEVLSSLEFLGLVTAEQYEAWRDEASTIAAGYYARQLAELGITREVTK